VSATATNRGGASPLVSIITPTYNPGSRLQRCIESVLAQTYANVEHVVVDGGSTDGTLEILNAHPQIRSVSESDDGQANALNKGFRMADGELLTWINADDTLNPEAVATIVDAWQQTGAEWIYGDCLMWEGDKSHLWGPPPNLDETSFDWVCPIAQQGTFFTKHAWEAVGGIDESYDLSMDYDLWLRFVEAGVRTTSVPDVLGTFEVHSASKTGSRGNYEFMREGSIALRRRGRVEASDLMIGRAAAHRAVEDSDRGPRVRMSRAKSELDRLKGSSPELAGVDTRTAMKAALVEAADLEIRRRRPPGHVAGMRHLLRVGPWLNPLTSDIGRKTFRIVAARAVERFKVKLGFHPL